MNPYLALFDRQDDTHEHARELAAASVTPDARRDAHRAVLTILANGPAADLTDMAADFLAAREPLRCPCGAECDHSHGLCAGCDAWAETLGGAA